MTNTMGAGNNKNITDAAVGKENKHLRHKILTVCQHMTFFDTYVWNFFYCTNLNKKGSATVV